MRELVLFSQIPAAREAQILSIFAGLTGTQPVEILEQTLIYQQLKVPEVALSKKVWRLTGNIYVKMQTDFVQQQQPKQAPKQKEQLSYRKLVRSYAIRDGMPQSHPCSLGLLTKRRQCSRH